MPQITFKEYAPALFSDVTLHLTGSQQMTTAESVSKITDLQFTVNYSLSGERLD